MFTLRNVCYAIAAVLVATVVYSAIPPSQAAEPPADLIAAVRADIKAVTAEVASVDTSVEASNLLLAEILKSLHEIRDQGHGRKAQREESPQAAATDPSPSPPPCIRLPGGADTDLNTLTSQATGRFKVQGMTYSQALVLNGFSLQEVAALSEEQCQQVYDGWKSSWKSSQPAPAPRTSTSAGPSRGSYRCSNGRCWRVN